MDIQTKFNKFYKNDFSIYHVDIIMKLNKKYNLYNKRILDVGGSNIPVEFIKLFGVKQLVCIDPISKYNQFILREQNYKKFDKKIISKNEILSNFNLFSYILDMDFEEKIDCFKDYFDVVISTSCFEHVNNVQEVVNNIYYYLNEDGVAHIQFEPIWSCAVGNHCWYDQNINFTIDRFLDWKHLLYSKEEAKNKIGKYYPEQITNRLIYQMYDSGIINRKFLNDHLLEIFNSNFNIFSIEYFCFTPLSGEVKKNLITKYGDMRYDVRGMIIELFKKSKDFLLLTKLKNSFFRLLSYIRLNFMILIYTLSNGMPKKTVVDNLEKNKIDVKITASDMYIYENSISILVKLYNKSEYDLTTTEQRPIFLSYHLYDDNNECVVWDGNRSSINLPPSSNDEGVVTYISIDKLDHIKERGKVTFSLVYENQFWVDQNYDNLCTINILRNN